VIALVGCGSAKTDHAAPAHELYTGAMFQSGIAYAKSRAKNVFIVSGKHGVLVLDQVVEPYDYKLTRKVANVWAEGVFRALQDRFGKKNQKLLLVMGDVYARPLRENLPRGWEVLEPLNGMRMPGRRINWLREKTEAGRGKTNWKT
jgi:hypothetical protein